MIRSPFCPSRDSDTQCSTNLAGTASDITTIKLATASAAITGQQFANAHEWQSNLHSVEKVCFLESQVQNPILTAPPVQLVRISCR